MPSMLVLSLLNKSTLQYAAASAALLIHNLWSAVHSPCGYRV
jgi:hypothetical protein